MQACKHCGDFPCKATCKTRGDQIFRVPFHNSFQGRVIPARSWCTIRAFSQEEAQAKVDALTVIFSEKIEKHQIMGQFQVEHAVQERDFSEYLQSLE